MKFSPENDRRERGRRWNVSGLIQIHNPYVQAGVQSNEHGHNALPAESNAAELRLLSADKYERL